MKILLKEKMQNCLIIKVLMKLKLYIILNELNNIIID